MNLEGRNVGLKATTFGNFAVIIGGHSGSDIFPVAQALRGASTNETNSELLRYTVCMPNNSGFTLELKEALMQRWQAVAKTDAHVRVVRNLGGRVVEDKFTEVLVSSTALVGQKEISDGGIFYVKFEDLEEGRVIQLWKSADDTLCWKSLTVEDVEKLLESGVDIRKLFGW